MADVDAIDPFVLAEQRLIAFAQNDPQLRAMLPLPAAQEEMQQIGPRPVPIVECVARHYADRAALATRAYDIATSPDTGRGVRRYRPAYDAITYAEMRQRVLGLASAWRHWPEHRVEVDDFVVNFGYTSADMTVLELACPHAQAVSVPLQAQLQPADLAKVFEDTAPVTIAASLEYLDLAVSLAPDVKSVRSVIAFDIDTRADEEREKLEAARAALAPHGIAVATIDELIAFGNGHDWTPLPAHRDGDERMALLIYTSGSTGTPKGAIITDKIYIAQHWGLWLGSRPRYPLAVVAYAPLHHISGRSAVFGALSQGGTVHFSLKSDWTSLFDDVRIARPTSFAFMPRVAELIHQHFLSEVQRRTSQGESRAKAESDVMAEMRHTFLGDRLHRGTVGSSPTSEELRSFIRDCFDIGFKEGYGTTESGGVIAWGYKVLRGYVTDYRLRDVPELGYYTTDKPYPRGEFTFKSRTTIPGYFKRPEASAAIYDEDGFQLTGDIVEERAPDEIYWIERRGNVVKLSQGEFVAVGALEKEFESSSALVHQIFIYNNSQKSFLVAAVVPDMEIAATRLGHEPSETELHQLVRAELQDVGRAAGFKTFEVPRDVIIDHEPFTFENGLLSPTRKPLRPKLKGRYGEALEKLYSDIARRQQEDLAALRDAGSNATTLDRLVGALKASLGMDEVDLTRPRTFRELGVDSLGAVSLSLLLEEIFSVPVAVSEILNPAGSPQRLAAQIDALLTGDSAANPTAESVHGAEPGVLRAEDLTVDAFIDRDTLARAPRTPPAQTRTVLITGASGFLGRFLCLDWLERLAPMGGKVICLIRAADADDARRRLEETFGDADPDLLAHFRALAADHLECLAGDLAAPRLGLGDAAFARLAAEVDQIVHPAALVNHRLSYQNLFGPNVAGTAELIRLALTTRLKRVDYVSSVAVANLMHDRAASPEAIDVRKGAPTVDLIDRYAMGYAASKWAGEVLLRDAHEKYGLPVNVYRADMILPHARYKGQINVPDMFTRLLFSLVKTGTAPRSFYQLGPDGERQRAHYDGFPVDFISGAMTDIGAEAYEGFHTYNIVNAHDDGVSLDSVADWVASAGYRIDFVADHADWLRRFEAGLRALPEDERQHGSLDILANVAAPYATGTAHHPSADFAAAVARLQDKPIPHITEAFIHKYLDDMRRLGLLGVPI